MVAGRKSYATRWCAIAKVAPSHRSSSKNSPRFRNKLLMEEVINPAQSDTATDKTSPNTCFCPHRPWPKQQQFLDLTCKEAFYGGAPAGGQSEDPVMAALQYVHVPGYAALILRKDTQRLRLAGGL